MTRVSAEQIRSALAECHGNMLATADRLGMARQTLYKRVTALGLDPSQHRIAVQASAPRPARPSRRSLRVVRGFSLRPDQLKALEDARFDLPAVLRVRFSPSSVLERFIDDAFAAWLQAKLGTK